MVSASQVRVLNSRDHLECGQNGSHSYSEPFEIWTFGYVDEIWPVWSIRLRTWAIQISFRRKCKSFLWVEDRELEVLCQSLKRFRHTEKIKHFRRYNKTLLLYYHPIQRCIQRAKNPSKNTKTLRKRKKRERERKKWNEILKFWRKDKNYYYHKMNEKWQTVFIHTNLNLK